MKKIFEIVVLIGIVIVLLSGLKALDNYEKNRAIERCGGVDNIVEKYTNQGDIYYQCKIEK